MIGQLQLHVASRPVTAQLHDDLRWTCPDPHVTEMLNQLFSADAHDAAGHDPATFARHLLFRAGSRLGGSVKLHHDAIGVADQLQMV